MSGKRNTIGGVPVWLLLVLIGPPGWAILLVGGFLNAVTSVVIWIIRLVLPYDEEDEAPPRRKYRRIDG